MIRRPWLIAGVSLAVFVAGLAVVPAVTRAEEAPESVDVPDELVEAFNDFVAARPRTRAEVPAYADGIIELGNTLLKDYPKATNVYDIAIATATAFTHKADLQGKLDFVGTLNERFATTEHRWEWEELWGDVHLEFGYRVEKTANKDEEAAKKTFAKAITIYTATRDNKEASAAVRNQARWNLGITNHWYLENKVAARPHWQAYLDNAGDEVTGEIVTVTTNLAACMDEAGETPKANALVEALYKRAAETDFAGHLEQTIGQRAMDNEDAAGAITWFTKALDRVPANDTRNRKPIEVKLTQAKLLGKPVPAFAVEKWMNSTVSSAEGLKGKVYLVEFWAVW
jgi:hypothetical protein